MLHIALKNICKKYILIVLESLCVIQLNQIAIDIKIYSEVHTGPKTHAGGLKDGCIICEYQGSL